MAIVIQEPPQRAFIGNPIWVGLQTDLIDTNKAWYQIALSGTGPTVGQVLTLTFSGGTITYTVGSSPTRTGLVWPVKSPSDTLVEYADIVADFLRQREDITAVFDITREATVSGSEIIRLTRKVHEEFSTVVTTNTMSNVAVTTHPIAATTTPSGLRGVVVVCSDSGDFNTDEELLVLHAPYRSDGTVLIDISAAFTGLSPDLPGNSSIAPTSNTWALHNGGALQPYYFRFADKYGAPALSEALTRSTTNYLAMAGSRAGPSIHATPDGLIRHNYYRSDGGEFRKPIVPSTPDWVYFLPVSDELDGPTFYVQVLLYWSDGTTSIYHPYGTSPRTYTDGIIQVLPSGYRQLFLHNQVSPGASDALIIAYDWRFMQPSVVDPVAVVRYDVDHLSTHSAFHLAYENGVGGIETVTLRGRITQEYSGQRTLWQRNKEESETQGDMALLSALASVNLEISSGFFDRWYLDHIRQLFHGKVWLVDDQVQRFVPMVITSEEFQMPPLDSNLHDFPLSIREAYINRNANT